MTVGIALGAIYAVCTSSLTTDLTGMLLALLPIPVLVVGPLSLYNVMLSNQREIQYKHSKVVQHRSKKVGVCSVRLRRWIDVSECMPGML